jgi:hypothetical protein
MPTKPCCFQQGFVVSDKRFVGKFRVPKLDKTRDGMPHLCPATRCDTKKIG